jgi:adenylosuccinate synthase
VEPASNGSVQPKGSGFTLEKSLWRTRERAHDIVEEGLDKLIESDTEAGEKLIDKAKQIDPKAVEELAEEVERYKENAERFVNKG